MRSRFLIPTVLLFVACTNESVPEYRSNTENSIVENDSLSSHTEVVQFRTPAVPSSIVFANETIELNDIDIKERFDRELVVNNFWHSNTLFYFKRANRWFPIMKQILEEENVPSDFVYLAVIESGLDQVTSPSGAKGFWQFMPATAMDFNLIVNDEIDERYHVEKSTRAAAKYLKSAYKQFGSWILAAASYNRGVAGVERDMEYQYGESFFDLHLNNETSRYIFRILAVKHIMENPEDFGFFLPEEALYPKIKVKTVIIQNTIDDLPKWAVENGVNFKILKKLNPWLLKSKLTVKPTDQIEVYLPEENEQLKPYKRS